MAATTEPKTVVSLRAVASLIAAENLRQNAILTADLNSNAVENSKGVASPTDIGTQAVALCAKKTKSPPSAERAPVGVQNEKAKRASAPR